ncbi:MAG TPA: hypothetical protein ENI19_02255 [Candidatus Nealsonbacteria bacterium]|uniref:DUF5671 domain-containing protein n=1 Tax=marine sediment metagenome TaxID=412755 RepID=A0A0F9VFH5_9ZZZZ|nr:hypothetical protein [Candidatus Nealsonbacteria bacterium]HEB46509.1 hypothetical protein [Candidatus Nealsonbacteria bacterium]
MKHYPLIRTIYLYLFALLGLVLLIIGGVRFVDMGLRAFVFTKAEEEQRLLRKEPPYMPYSIQKIEELQENEERLSEEEKAAIGQWLTDYKDWQERRSKIDYLTSKRHRDASVNLALILVGLPLYLYHWRIIRKETKNREETQTAA